MHRSTSLNRSLDEFPVNLPLSSASPSPNPAVKRTYSSVAVDLLPRYVDDCQKKQSRFRAEHAVHLIPFMLIFCVLVLWFAGSSEGTIAVELARILGNNQKGNFLVQTIQSNHSSHAI